MQENPFSVGIHDKNTKHPPIPPHVQLVLRAPFHAKKTSPIYTRISAICFANKKISYHGGKTSENRGDL